MEGELKEQAEFRKRTLEEQAKEIESTRISMLKRIFRRIYDKYLVLKNNFDLILLVLVALIMITVGYYVARIRFGFTIQEIKLGIWDFIEFLIAISVGIITLIGSIMSKAGDFKKKLNGIVETPHDEDGRTLKPTVKE